LSQAESDPAGSTGYNGYRLLSYCFRSCLHETSNHTREQLRN
jgi:hypothetical protein